MQSIETVRSRSHFRQQHRAQPALIGVAVAVSTFLLGLALLPQPSADVVAYEAPQAIDMMGPMPAEYVVTALQHEYRLPAATGHFEETPPEAIHEVWG